jgi:peptidoglycan hydrolase-like protein with peptidoglycan-binding domain
MLTFIKRGDTGPEVKELQHLLNRKGYPVTIDGIFGNQTYRGLCAFQSKNLDQHRQPPVVDGKAGPLTWWSLTHPKPVVENYSAVDYTKMPPEDKGGSEKGRLAPVPGEIVIWWRVSQTSWQGHTGIVHQLKDGILYTIEGNRSPRVQGFSYVLGRMEKLLGYGKIPD